MGFKIRSPNLGAMAPKKKNTDHQTQLPVRWQKIIKCLCNDCEDIRILKETDIAELETLKEELKRLLTSKSRSKAQKMKIQMADLAVKQKEYDIQDEIIAERDHQDRASLKRDIIYSDKVDAVSGWRNLSPQNEDIQLVEEEFEGLQDAVENRGKDTAEGVGELTCLEMVQPSKEVIENKSWKDFYELMPGQFRKHQRTGKKFQIYKVRCVGEKSAFCIFLGPDFTNPWFVVPRGG